MSKYLSRGRLICPFIALMAILILVSLTASANFVLESDQKTTEITNFLAHIEQLVPEEMKTRLKRTIWVQFVSYNGDRELEIPDCAPQWVEQSDAPVQTSQILGEVKSSQIILLNSHFLKVIGAGEAKAPAYDCGHRNHYRLAQAALLNQLAKLSELYPTKGSHRSLIEVINGAEKRSTPPSSILEEALFNRVFAWRDHNPANIFDHHPTLKNVTRYRSYLDESQHEITRLEDFAQCFEYFILDPENRCRRPLIYKFLSEFYKHKPHDSFNCEVNTHVVLHSIQEGGHAGSWVNLDPKRIHSIQYMVASEGNSLGSRLGHSMFRVVRCAPHRKEISDECLTDFAHHVILSLNANITDGSINPLKGLIGSYASQFFLWPYRDVIEHYTHDQQRNLISYPLSMSEEEKEAFIYQMLSFYWKGPATRYYFFLANCKHEATDLLQTASDRLCAIKLKSQTPSGLAKELCSKDLIEDSMLEDSQSIKEYQLLVSPYWEELKDVYQFLESDFKSGYNLDDYIHLSSAIERRSFIEQMKSHPEKLQILTRFKFLEQEIKKRTSKFYDAKMDIQHSGLSTEIVTQALEEIKKSKSPFTYLVRGHGIPMESDFLEINQASLINENTLKEQLTAIQGWKEENFPTLMKELADIDLNLQLIEEWRFQ